MTKPFMETSSIRLATDIEAPQRRVELAREVFGRQILRVEVEPLSENGFQADLRLRALPGLKLITGWATGVMVERTASLLSDGNDDIIVGIGGVEGRLITEQRGVRAVLERGHVRAVLNAEPFSLVHIGSLAPGLTVARKTLAALVPDIEDRIAQPVRPFSEGLRLLEGYIAALSSDRILNGTEATSTAVTHIHDLLGHILGASREGEEIIATRGLKAARLLAIKSQIGRSLVDHHFSLDTVVATQCLSRRYVQRLFEEEGTTFSAYLTNQRLKQAARFLEKSGSRGRTISAIAYDCGFGDVTHFNRLFRRLFDLTPSDLRAKLAIDGLPAGYGQARRTGPQQDRGEDVGRQFNHVDPPHHRYR
jgi:AraC-like DNA-binding protein